MMLMSKKRMQARSIYPLYSLLILLFVSLFISSCSSLNQRGRGVEDFNFHTGTQGMELRFLQGNPPQRLYAGDPLNVLVEYTNKGAYPVVDGRLYLTGFDREYLRFDREEVIGFGAEGKSALNPEGMISELAEFKDPAVSMPPETDAFRQIIKATACYSYKTFASPMVCIDPDPLNIEQADKVCLVQNVGMNSQGAPVAVKSVDVDAARGRVQFKITVQNVGGGTVIESRNGYVPLDRCQALLSRDEIDKVEIRAFLSQNQALDCKPAVIRLVNGKGFAYCSFSGLDPRADAYMTALSIELSYGYRNSVATTTDILSLPGSNDRLLPSRYLFRR